MKLMVIIIIVLKVILAIIIIRAAIFLVVFTVRFISALVMLRSEQKQANAGGQSGVITIK